MKKFFRSIFAFCALIMSSQLAQADNYSDTVTAFQNAGETSGFFQEAYGYVVFPTIGKGGIGIGGAHGKGRVFSQGVYIGDSSMTQITLGFQLGGQAFSQMIFFKDQRALQEFTSGNFEFSAQASAVALRRVCRPRQVLAAAVLPGSAVVKMTRTRCTVDIARVWLFSPSPRAASCMKRQLADKNLATAPTKLTRNC